MKEVKGLSVVRFSSVTSGPLVSSGQCSSTVLRKAGRSGRQPSIVCLIATRLCGMWWDGVDGPCSSKQTKTRIYLPCRAVQLQFQWRLKSCLLTRRSLRRRSCVPSLSWTLDSESGRMNVTTLYPALLDWAVDVDQGQVVGQQLGPAARPLKCPDGPLSSDPSHPSYRNRTTAGSAGGARYTGNELGPVRDACPSIPVGRLECPDRLSGPAVLPKTLSLNRRGGSVLRLCT